MRELRYCCGWGCVLLLLLAAGCRGRGPEFDARKPGAKPVTDFQSVTNGQEVLQQLRQPAGQAFTLGPGDRIEIEVFGEEIRSTTKVGPDGRIYFYLLPGLDVWGLTLEETRQLLEEKLQRYIQIPAEAEGETDRPWVGVTLREVGSKRIWLLGRLKDPGIYPLAAPTTLLEAISLAGGTQSSESAGTTKELADLRHAFVIRKGEKLPVDLHELVVEGDLSHNIYLRPDDFVYVPSALSREIYVLGAVRAPQAVSPEGEATLVTAIAAAGGALDQAHKSQVAIVRGSLAEPKIAVVSYGDILKGRVPDVPLQPRDIVYVPLNPYRKVYEYADLIVTTFVRAIAINEGARAVSDQAGSVGVTIGVSPQ